MKAFIPMVALALLVAACQSGPTTEPQKKGSSGKTLELLVAADRNIYPGEVEELIDSLFGRPQEALSSMESMFDVVDIPMSSYENTEMFRNHRNILLIDIKPDNPDKVYLHIDEFAAPQVVVDVAATSRDKVRELLLRNEKKIFEEYYKAEHRRIIKAFRGMQNYELNQKIRDKFGFGLMFASEFSLAKTDDDFAWVRKEAKDFGLGVLVDVMPYKSQADFDEQNLLDRLDSTMKREVPSNARDSYMGIERRRDEAGNYLAPILYKTVEFDNSQYAVELRGSWRSFGDFMGGPFVSYAVLSPDGRKIIILTGYVYCPRNKPWTKRDLLMQAESICWSLDFKEE